MKKAKYEISLSLKVIIVSIVLYIVFQFRIYKDSSLYCYLVANINNQFLINVRTFNIVIFSGLFVSALMSLVLSIKEYRYQKRKVLSDFYMKSTTILREILNIKFLEFDKSYDCFLKIISEEIHNNANDYNLQIKEIAKKMSKKKRRIFLESHLDIKSEAKDKFTQSIIDELVVMDVDNLKSPKEKAEYAEREYKEKLAQYYKGIDLSAKSILKMKNLYCDELTILIDDIDFWANKKQQERIHKKLYMKLLNQVKRIRQVASFCENYFNGDKGYDKSFIVQNIARLQRNMIDKTNQLTYNRFVYEVELELENLLNIINNNRQKKILNEKSFWVSNKSYLGEYISINEEE